MTRRKLATMLATMAVPSAAFLALGRARAAAPIPVTLYKNLSCTCCEEYARYLEQNGFKVDVEPTNDLPRSAARPAFPKGWRAATRVSSATMS